MTIIVFLHVRNLRYPFKKNIIFLYHNENERKNVVILVTFMYKNIIYKIIFWYKILKKKTYHKYFTFLNEKKISEKILIKLNTKKIFKKTHITNKKYGFSSNGSIASHIEL